MVKKEPMSPRKEDIDLMDKILKIYVLGELNIFGTFEIANKLNIENGHARFIRDKLNELNDEKSFFRVEMSVSGDFCPLEDGTFLINRFFEDGGCANHYEESFDPIERASIGKRIDRILEGQILLAEGQLELSEQLNEHLPEMKSYLTNLNKKVWISVLRDNVLSTAIGLGINTENLNSLVESVEESLGIK